MPSTSKKPILNTSLPQQFRQVRIELAREPGHPSGAAEIAYVMIVPLDANARIDAKLWREHREACRVARLRPGEPDEHGHLVHRPGGGWAFHYGPDAHLSDETGFPFADEHFVRGEYLSVNEQGSLHTYRIVSASYL